MAVTLDDIYEVLINLGHQVSRVADALEAPRIERAVLQQHVSTLGLNKESMERIIEFFGTDCTIGMLEKAVGVGREAFDFSHKGLAYSDMQRAIKTHLERSGLNPEHFAATRGFKG